MLEAAIPLFYAAAPPPGSSSLVHYCRVPVMMSPRRKKNFYGASKYTSGVLKTHTPFFSLGDDDTLVAAGCTILNAKCVHMCFAEASLDSRH